MYTICDQVSSQLKQSKIQTTFSLSSSILLYLLQMSTSGGGGYCDCGDIEAWKAHPYCELHNIDSKPSSNQVCFNKSIIKAVIRDWTIFFLIMLRLKNIFFNYAEIDFFFPIMLKIANRRKFSSKCLFFMGEIKKYFWEIINLIEMKLYINSHCIIPFTALIYCYYWYSKMAITPMHLMEKEEKNS